MNVGSLFSGIGGIELGFKQAGFKTEWFVECEPYAQQILRKRWPAAEIYDDVTALDFKTVPKVAVLTGGFPCQDISNAGKRTGIEGSRSSLWAYYCEAISEIRPRVAFIENVSALLGRGLDVVLCDLSQIGYDAEWYCVPASAVGANHQRDRIFIVAYPHDTEEGKHAGSDRSEEGEIRWGAQGDIFAGCGDAGGDWQVADTGGAGLQGEECQGGYVAGQGFWAVEPCVGRVADGVSCRVDRIKCLGNAVVPQVAEVFAQAIRRCG